MERTYAHRIGTRVAFAAAVLALTTAGGCAEARVPEVPDGESAEGLGLDTEPATMRELALDGELSPRCGQRFGGGVDAQVPLRGIVARGDEPITALAFDWETEEWLALGAVRSDPVPLVEVDGEPMYGFDFGVACARGECDVALTDAMLGGDGDPHGLRLRFEGATLGPLPSRGADGGEELCHPHDPAQVLVILVPEAEGGPEVACPFDAPSWFVGGFGDSDVHVTFTERGALSTFDRMPCTYDREGGSVDLCRDVYQCGECQVELWQPHDEPHLSDDGTLMIISKGSPACEGEFELRAVPEL